jgi:hypothetical protein
MADEPYRFSPPPATSAPNLRGDYRDSHASPRNRTSVHA